MQSSTHSLSWYQMEASIQPHAPPSEKDPFVPIGQETGWSPRVVWMYWKRNKSFARYPVILASPACSLVTIPTDPSWLLFIHLLNCLISLFFLFKITHIYKNMSPCSWPQHSQASPKFSRVAALPQARSVFVAPPCITTWICNVATMFSTKSFVGIKNKIFVYLCYRSRFI